jgi:aquaporin Z
VTHTPAGWREYAIEGLLLGVFMISASAFATALYHPASPLSAVVTDPLVRRILMGLAMGSTAVALIYSRLGARSGAHMNPAVTLAFWRLGTVDTRTAVGYAVGQFIGGLSGVLAALWLLRGLPADPSVDYVSTLPGPWGLTVAFLAEMTIAGTLISIVLSTMGRGRVSSYTGVVAGAYVALCIMFEAPLSGMSMNPARSVGSNVIAGHLDTLWIYLLAPTLGMQFAVAIFTGLVDHRRSRPCPRLYHPAWIPCVFGCEKHAAHESPSRSTSDVQLTV